MATLLGFDFGPRKIGVAVGQTITGTATALETVRAQGQRPDWQRLEAIIREWQPDAVVVGLPFNMDDSEERWSDRVHRFARQLQGRFGLHVHLVDERLTSLEARRQLKLSPYRADDRIDAQAAKLILETWLADAPSAEVVSAVSSAPSSASRVSSVQSATERPPPSAPGAS
ncbi:MAG: Holliday junction resolvase RuvX [Lamprobacter sp.]|uniref:Holliday junction resolvase RuvX n=1 Tax=Lamprobacter sp. TaxID=3100796 RepID=UPI002B25B741|nr:Holliday junction resolvase RuvX [Lamprobacter sp.]MEA3640503.1 Holliday junction resolvase RuvX [Lamprobacter sp.]